MDFEKIYNDLGITYKPLPTEYNPDQYAKELMNQFRDSKGVSYATSTTAFLKQNIEIVENSRW